MKMRIINLTVLAAALMLSVSSCSKDDSEKKKADEKRILENYILTNYHKSTPTESGIYYIEEKAGTGEFPIPGNWIELKYTCRLVLNNAVVMTTDIVVAEENNIFQTGIYYGPARLILGNISISGLNEGIAMMKEGGKGRIIIPSELALGGRSSQLIPAYSSLIFDVELVKVIPDIHTYETGLMTDYLVANGFSTDSTSTGIYFKQVTPGEGDVPVAGSRVTVTYTGRFINGKVFDGTGKAFAFTVGTGAVIPGFEGAVKMIRMGGSGTAVIPYYNAYGAYGMTDSYYRIVVPPYFTLVFDINVNLVAK